MTYDQWKTDSGYGEPVEDQPTELDLVYYDLAQAREENRRLRDALQKAQKIIEREFPNGQTAIDIRNALAALSRS